MIDPQTITEAKRALGRQLAALREAAGKTQHQLAQQISYGRSTIANTETGYSTCRRTFWEHADKALHAGGALLAGYDDLQALTRHHHIQTAHLIEQRRTAAASFPSAVLSEDRRAAAERWGRPGQHDVELLRQDLDDVLVEGTMAQASLDDWERTVARYGRASRDRSASALLQDLSIDLVDLKRALRRHRSASALRRLTRVTAHMSGLMCLTLCKLDNRPAFRRWARTARLAATEAGDPATHSWILAQESYGHYYSGNLVEAVEVALRSQEMVSSSPCVGAALAAALEARAHAAMHHDQETRAALGRAEQILSRLDGDALSSSAFGYNEAQLRFHEGNAFTHLGDARSAFVAQDRALRLCAPGDYTDWAMTRLDRAHCLIVDGDADDAVGYAIETLTALTEQQRRGIITLRGYQVLHALPPAQTTPAARDLRDLLMLTTERGEVPKP